jgi:hypothetical protein
MAEDAVPSEPFSAKFPANREKYREFVDFGPFNSASIAVGLSFCLTSGTNRQFQS